MSTITEITYSFNVTVYSITYGNNGARTPKAPLAGAKVTVLTEDKEGSGKTYWGKAITDSNGVAQFTLNVASNAVGPFTIEAHKVHDSHNFGANRSVEIPSDPNEVVVADLVIGMV